MKHRLILSMAALIFICAPTWAQKSKTSATKTTSFLSNAEDMSYARATKYWGPGTFYLYAPGKPINKTANNALSNMRGLIGISREDCNTEIAKQSFSAVPETKKKTWYKPLKGIGGKYYYSPDKSFIIEPIFEDLYMSPVKEDGKYAYATKGVVRHVLIPTENSDEVIEHIWQFLRDIKELGLGLGTFGSNFKNADPKAYPIQRVMSGSWTGFRAGSWLLRNNGGKVEGVWGNNEEILRRTIGMPEFHFVTNGYETDFNYSLFVDLTKDGYVLRYEVVSATLSNLVPGTTWQMKYPELIKVYKMGIKANEDAIETYKKAPFPPVLEDLDKLLHLK